ncbi:response regulator [Treponema zuelzerae]|uniref:Response regulator n=1 Tax=Teretinema zuelzerae TaxID=156 RepID=A0AAE3JI94_9SPIR|nr:response regulator [Teretinema zuelzerae]MCD1653998.1 response regulator [Teretinema zuelzerae]
MSNYILFVDDEDKILLSLERELEDWLEERGLAFRSAGSANQALEILNADHDTCQAVVSDLKMPQRKGSELLLEIARRWPALGTIRLTGFSDMDEIKDCIKAGIVSFLQKPWNRDILRAELERVVALTRLRREHDEYFRRLETDFTWTRRLHHELLLNEKLPGDWGRIDIGTAFAGGTLDCGGDLILSFQAVDGALFLCFGSLSVTGVEGTFHGAKIRESLLLAGRGLDAGTGPDALLASLNETLCSDFPDLPENSLSLSAFRFSRGDDFFSCAHAGGEHFALVDSGRLAVHTLPSPVLGVRGGVIYPVKRYAFRSSTTLVLFSRLLYRTPSLEPLFVSALEGYAKGDSSTSAGSLLGGMLGSRTLPFDSTLALFRLS